MACASKDSYISLYKIGKKNDNKSIVFDKKSTFSLATDYYVTKESLLKGHTESVVSIVWS